ncbi:MAG TPA: adenylate/guanylate cyclase domain-containing protein [Roseiarcus sp.]|nr:adenylate/guanylate cyclase domain-containing protein [Roseiarcus sp.]
MAEIDTLWTLLAQSADAEIAASLKSLVATGDDRALNRINALAYAAERGHDEEAVISALIHAARLGLFDLSWNVLCPGCGGVLETGSGLKTLDRHEYFCSLCAGSYEPTLDELVEVTFTVNPRIRHIAAHDPETLPLGEYARQIFWGSGVDLPGDIDAVMNELTLDAMELAPGEKAAMSLTLPESFIIAFDPVTHTTLFLEVSGEPTHERRNVSLVFSDLHANAGKLTLQPGPARISFENRTGKRTIPGLWIAGEAMHRILGKRRPFLTATRLLSNQTFRDLYRTGTLDKDQRFKITNLTILFTDLRGSTALYDRVGDLAAFDLVRDHFSALLNTVAAEGGAVVKTIGDAVMATFPSPDRAVRAAMKMRGAMRQINESRGSEDLALNIGLHEGPCLAVMLDERQDYFGQTVNVASRVQGLADPSAILVTKPIVEAANVAKILSEAGMTATERQAYTLRGISEPVPVYELR